MAKLKAAPKEASVIEEGVEANEVQPGQDGLTGYNPFKIVQLIEKKDPKHAYAWPMRQQAQWRHEGWRMCKIVAGPDVKEVDSIEEAEVTTDCVLCRRPIEVDRRARSENEKRRLKSNQLQGIERSRDYLSKAVTEQVGKREGLNVAPLPEREFAED